MRLKQLFSSLVVGVSAVMAFSSAASAADMTGAGATFPYPIYAKWAESYKAATGNGLNYQSVGSGAGIKQIKAKTVDFGASDMPLKAEELDAEGLMQFPAIMGGVVTVVNLDGITPGQLKLTGPVIADIYLGKVTLWNAAEIAALNPGVKLPATEITVVHRADGSGTSFLFTDYLSKTNAEFKTKIGAGTAVKWVVGVGGKGNEGVAANAEWTKTPGFGVVLTDQAGKNSWPITGVSFILMHKQQADAAKGKEVIKFFEWAFKNGGASATELDYVPLPATVVKLVQDSWKANLKDASGKAIY